VIFPPSNTNIWIAAGITDMRRGFTGLSAAAQTVLEQNPYSGHVFVFRGKRGDLVKVLWWDGDGLCLFAKRLERGRFVWPQADKGVVSLSPCAALDAARRHRLAKADPNSHTRHGGIEHLFAKMFAYLHAIVKFT
jgi:transposase